MRGLNGSPMKGTDGMRFGTERHGKEPGLDSMCVIDMYDCKTKLLQPTLEPNKFEQVQARTSEALISKDNAEEASLS